MDIFTLFVLWAWRDDLKKWLIEVIREPTPNERYTVELKVALERLVILKDEKDKNGKTAKYLNNQPAAWRNARMVLYKYNER